MTPLAFLEALYGDQTRGTLFLAGGPRRADGKMPGWHDRAYGLARPGTLEAMARHAEAATQREEVYLSMAIYAGPKRQQSQAVLFPVLFADLDGGSIPLSVPEPTITVLSSLGHRQCFWKLNRPAQPSPALDLNRRIARATGADMSGWDATQVLRMPGTLNHKRGGCLVATEAATGVMYQVEDFQHLPAVPSFTAPATGVLGATVEADSAAWDQVKARLSRRMWAVAMGDATNYEGDESRADMALLCGLLAAGLTADEAASAFAATPRGRMLMDRKGEDRFQYLLALGVARAVQVVGQAVVI